MFKRLPVPGVAQSGLLLLAALFWSTPGAAEDILPEWCEYKYDTQASFEGFDEARRGLAHLYREGDGYRVTVTCQRRDRRGAFGDVWAEVIRYNDQQEPTHASLCRYHRRTSELSVEGARLAQCVYQDDDRDGFVRSVALLELPHESGGTVLSMEAHYIGSQTKARVALSDYHLESSAERKRMFFELMGRVEVR